VKQKYQKSEGKKITIFQNCVGHFFFAFSAIGSLAARHHKSDL
jgi:hypothetical protein